MREWAQMGPFRKRTRALELSKIIKRRAGARHRPRGGLHPNLIIKKWARRDRLRATVPKIGGCRHSCSRKHRSARMILPRTPRCSYNNLGTEGVAALAGVFMALKGLRTLDLGYCRVGAWCRHGPVLREGRCGVRMSLSGEGYGGM